MSVINIYEPKTITIRRPKRHKGITLIIIYYNTYIVKRKEFKFSFWDKLSTAEKRNRAY